MVLRFVSQEGGRATKIEPQEEELDILFRTLSAFAVASQKIDGKAIVPAMFNLCPERCWQSGKTGRNGRPLFDCGGQQLHRLSLNVTHLTALIIDIDKVTDVEFQAELHNLAGRGLTYAWWHTWSHAGPEKTCARILIPFDRPFPISFPEEWSKWAWPGLLKALGVAHFDRSCAHANCLYYYPAHPDDEFQRDSGASWGVLLNPVHLLGERSTQPAPVTRLPKVHVVDNEEMRPVDLAKVRSRLDAIQKAGHREYLQRFLKGEPLTPPPEDRAAGLPGRRTVWRTVTADIANVLEGWESSMAIFELFFPSFEVMVADSPNDFVPWDEIEDLFERARADAPAWRAQREAKQRASVERMRAVLHGAAKPTSPDSPVSANTSASDAGASPSRWKHELERAAVDLKTRLGSEASDAKIEPFFSPASELLKKTFPPTPWLIDGLLIEKSVCVVAGEPKTLKTWKAIEMGVAVATGTPAFGQFAVPETGGVALFLAEDDERGTRNRLRALSAGRGKHGDGLSQLYFECRGRLDLQSDVDLVKIIGSCRMLSEPPVLVVLDPLRDLHRADENDSTAMSEVMGRLRALRDILDCSILLVHHVAKVAKETAGRSPGQRMRGSSVVHGAVDAGIYITESTTDNTADGNSLRSARVHVELKAARGAGDFRLTLTIRDSISGDALWASWDCERGGTKSRTDEALERVLGLIVGELRVEWDLAGPGQPKPLSQATLRQRVAVGMAKVDEALSQVQKRGLGRQVFKGFKPIGWVLIPQDPSADQREAAPPSKPAPELPAAVRTGSNSSEPVATQRWGLPSADLNQTDPNSPKLVSSSGGFEPNSPPIGGFGSTPVLVRVREDSMSGSGAPATFSAIDPPQVAPSESLGPSASTRSKDAPNPALALAREIQRRPKRASPTRRGKR